MHRLLRLPILLALTWMSIRPLIPNHPIAAQADRALLWLQEQLPWGANLGIFPAMFLLYLVLGVISPRDGNGRPGSTTSFLIRARQFSRLRASAQIIGALGSVNTRDFFCFRLLDFGEAFAVGWLKKLLWLLAFSGAAWWLWNAHLPLGSAIACVVGVVVLVLMSGGRLHLASSSGCGVRYFGWGCADYLDDLSRMEPGRYLTIVESSAWTWQELLLNLRNVAVLIHGRRLRWGYFVGAALLLGLSYLVGQPNTLDWLPDLHNAERQVLQERLVQGSRAFSAVLIMAGVVFAALCTLRIQFAGGQSVEVFRAANIRTVLAAAHESSQGPWLEVTRSGLLGDKRWFFSQQHLAVVCERWQVPWLLFLLAIGSSLAGYGWDTPGLYLLAGVFLILAVLFSLNRVRYFSRGGFQHEFRNRSAEADAEAMA